MDVKTFDPQKMTVIVAGNILTGFAPNTIVEMDFAEDSVETVVGADGEYSRVIKRNESAEITISLQHTSPSNDVLSALHDLDKATGLGYGPALIKDESGRAVAGSEAVWVKKKPPFKRGTGIETNEWVLGCGKAYCHLGGN